MALEPEVKRLKMDVHVRGDDNSQEIATVSGVFTSKTFNLRAPTGSPSGDFGNTDTHEFVSFIGNVKNDNSQSTNEPVETVKQTCDLGDTWVHKYPYPLSNIRQRPVRTGNLYYDRIIADIEMLGYRPLQVIAKGRSSTLLIAQNLRNMHEYMEYETRPVVVKLNSGRSNRKQSGSKTDMTEELEIHSRLSHPNIVQWLGNIDYQGRLATVMEFCSSGTLEQLIKQQDRRFLTENIARRYYRQILSAVKYIHQQGYAHRDLCLQNVLVSHDNVAKLCDFGHAVTFTDTETFCDDECGSLGYQAPEILNKIPYNPKLSDIWSLGAMLYLMCTGRLPWGVIRSNIIENASKSIKFPDTKQLPLSSELKCLISGLLSYIPPTRFTLNHASHHDWVLKSDDKTMIGNFYLTRQPQKTGSGSMETEFKKQFDI